MTEIYDPLWTDTNDTPHAGDDEFNSGNSLASFTTVTTGGTAVWQNGPGFMSCKATNTPVDALTALLKPITVSSGGYIETALRMMMPVPGNTYLAGLLFADGTSSTSNCCVMGYGFGNSSGVSLWILAGTLNSFEANGGSHVNIAYELAPFNFLRAIWVSSNTFQAQASPDGVSWDTIGLPNQSKTMTPTHMGIWCSDFGNSTSLLATFEYLRCSG